MLYISFGTLFALAAVIFYPLLFSVLSNMHIPITTRTQLIIVTLITLMVLFGLFIFAIYIIATYLVPVFR